MDTQERNSKQNNRLPPTYSFISDRPTDICNSGAFDLHNAAAVGQGFTRVDDFFAGARNLQLF